MIAGLIACVKDAHECFLGDLYVANAFHSFFTLFLSFEDLHFSCNVAAVQFCGYVFSECFYCFPCDYFSADSDLQRYFELVSWDRFSKFYNKFSSARCCVVSMNDERESVNGVRSVSSRSLHRPRSPRGRVGGPHLGKRSSRGSGRPSCSKGSVERSGSSPRRRPRRRPARPSPRSSERQRSPSAKATA